MVNCNPTDNVRGASNRLWATYTVTGTLVIVRIMISLGVDRALNVRFVVFNCRAHSFLLLDLANCEHSALYKTLIEACEPVWTASRFIYKR